MNEHYKLSSGDTLDQQLLYLVPQESIHYFIVAAFTYIFRAGVKKTTSKQRDIKAALNCLNIIKPYTSAHQAWTDFITSMHPQYLISTEPNRLVFAEIFIDEDYRLSTIILRLESWLKSNEETAQSQLEDFINLLTNNRLS